MFFELRQYKTKPGMRDAWVKTMEEKILPFHASKGVVVSGSFTGRDDDNTYVWLRRFDSHGTEGRLRQDHRGERLLEE